MFPPVFRLHPDDSVRLNNELKAQPLGNRIWLTGQPQYQDHFGQYGKGDTAAATKLLEDAGYAKGADGIYAKDGRRLSLRISTTAGNQLRETQGQLFQAQMKDIGVGIKIANVDATKHFGEWLPTATSTSPTSPRSATPSPSPPARTPSPPAARATTARTPARRSTSCS